MSSTRLMFSNLTIADIKQNWLREDFGTGTFVWLRKVPEDAGEYQHLISDLKNNVSHDIYFEGDAENLPLLFQAINKISNEIAAEEHRFEILNASHEDEDDTFSMAMEYMREEPPLFTLKQEIDCENAAELCELQGLHSRLDSMKIYFYKKNTDKEIEILLEKLPVSAQDYADLIADLRDAWDAEEKCYKIGGMTYLIADRCPDASADVRVEQVKEIENFVNDLAEEFYKMQNSDATRSISAYSESCTDFQACLSPSMEKSIASTVTDEGGDRGCNSTYSSSPISNETTDDEDNYFMGCKIGLTK